MTDILQKQYENRISSLSTEVHNLKDENQMLKQQIAVLQKMAFGPKSEKSKRLAPPENPDQGVLFNEAETEAKKNAEEPLVDVPAHKRRKHAHHWDEILAKYPHEKRIITLPEEDRVCKRCGSGLTSMGMEKIRTEVEFIPASVKVIDVYRESFQCLECRKQGHFSVEKPVVPQKVMLHSLATASTVARVIVQKYQFAVPLYRQEIEWKNIGIPLPRATLANWVIHCSEDWLTPVVSRLRELLLEQPVIHADETPVQVHREKGRKNTTRSYMWVFTNGEYETDRQIRLYQYRPGRSGSFASDFLGNYSGILQTDGYTGYERVNCGTHVLCWAHARRYFVDAIPPGLSEAEIDETVCGQAVKQINELFAIDKSLADLTPEERQESRLRLEQSKLEAFFAWLETESGKAAPKSALGKAIQYVLGSKDGLTAYLKDGHSALSNNICERAIRNFTIGRKNWLFSDSPKGADASAAAYSIIETCKANGLDPFKYLTFLFETMPNLDFKRHPERIDECLPWNADVQEKCK